MASAPRQRSYLRFWGPDVDADVDEELRFHLEMRAREYEAQGLDPEEARRRALDRFGPVDHVSASLRTHDRHRERASQWRRHFRDVVQDLRYGVRGLRRAPAFTAIAVITLALGIGANSVMFSLVDAIVLRPVPGVREPGRLFEWVGSTVLAYPDYLDYAAADAGVMDLAGFAGRELAVQAGGDPAIHTVELTSGNYFAMLGTHAQAGRVLGPTDDAPGAPLVAVVSDRYWRSQLGGDRSAIGRTLHVSGAPVTIVGVAEPSFRGTRIARVPELWVPIAAWPAIQPSAFVGLDLRQRGWGWLTLIGRFRPGVTREQAQAVARAASQHMRELYPNFAFENGAPTLEPIAATAAGDHTQEMARFMAVLLMVVATVLLLACANVANLLLARAARREPEIAVRAALGATRWRLVRQLSVEAAVLGLLATVVALAATWMTLRLLRGATLGGQIVLGAVGVALNPAVLAFTAIVALATVALFGLAPALQAARGGGSGSGGGLRTSSRTVSGSFRLRDALLIVQVVLSLVLLIGAGLFTRGLQRGLKIDVGVRPDHLATAAVNPGLVHYDSTRAAQYVDAATERIKALPGVESVSWAVSLPASGHNTEMVGIEGHVPTTPGPLGPGSGREEVTVNIVSPAYVHTMGGTLVRGREFTATDRLGTPPVALVSETFARQYWPGQDPIGRRVAIDDTMTVVGVVHDMKVERLDEAPPPLVYLAMAQHLHWMVDDIRVVARTTDEPRRMLPVLTRALIDVRPDVPVFGAATFGDAIDDVVAPQRLGAMLLGAFSLLALVVAAAGIYGVVAFLVSQRTREIGIRLALGARPARVVALVVGDNLRRVAIGIGIGLVIAALATRVVSSFLFGLSPTDGATYASTAAVLAVVGAIAAYLPARRVLRVNPVESLRAE